MPPSTPPEDIPLIPAVSRGLILLAKRRRSQMTKDAKRLTGQFLNGLSVAVMTAGIIAPAALGSFSWLVASIAGGVGLVLHLAALRISS